MILIAFKNLFRHRLRTFLSLIGVVIGVAAIVGLVSVVDGLFFEVEESVSTVQGLRVTIPGGGAPIFPTLDIDWLSKLDKIKGVKVTVPIVIGIVRSFDGKFGDVSGFFGSNGRIIGLDIARQLKAGSKGSFGGDILEGRDLEATDKGVVIISEAIKDNKNKFVGNKVKLNGKTYRIVGVYETGAGFFEETVIMPIADARQNLNFPTKKVSLFNVTLENTGQESLVARKINFQYGDDIEAFSASDTAQQFGDFLNNFRLLVILVAGISAIVAGIGIINTMIMSVLERFREIGALRAIGWTKNDVIKVIMYEALSIGIVGGIFGLILGQLIAWFLTFQFGLTTRISVELALQAFLFAVLVGLLGGIYPAIIASKLNPIDAIRTE